MSLFGIIKKCFLAPRGNFWNVDTFIIQWALLLRDRLNYATKRKKCGESQITANQPMAMRMTLFHSDFHSFIKSISLPPQLSVTSFLRFNSLCLSISTAFCVISLRFILLHYNLIFSFYLAFVSRSTLGSNTESLWMRACLGEVDDAVCDTMHIYRLDSIQFEIHLKMILSVFDNTYDWCEFLSSAQSHRVDFMLNHKIIPIQYIVIHIYSSMFAKPILCLFVCCFHFILFSFSSSNEIWKQLYGWLIEAQWKELQVWKHHNLLSGLSLSHSHSTSAVLMENQNRILRSEMNRNYCCWWKTNFVGNCRRKTISILQGWLMLIVSIVCNVTEREKQGFRVVVHFDWQKNDIIARSHTQCDRRELLKLNFYI